jgi:hypothetical protein
VSVFDEPASHVTSIKRTVELARRLGDLVACSAIRVANRKWRENSGNPASMLRRERASVRDEKLIKLYIPCSVLVNSYNNVRSSAGKAFG